MSTVKYLDELLDDDLTWSSHISHLSSHLARYSRLCYILRPFATKETLSMLYYSRVYSRIQYRISAWGTASENKLKQLRVRLNTILRIIGKKDYNTHITELYQQVNSLVLDDVYKLELAKIMYLLHHNDLPPVLHCSFAKLKYIHSHNTRQLDENVYFLPRVNKSLAENLLAFRGIKLWSTINPSKKTLHWISVKKEIINLIY